MGTCGLSNTFRTTHTRGRVIVTIRSRRRMTGSMHGSKAFRRRRRMMSSIPEIQRRDTLMRVPDSTPRVGTRGSVSLRRVLVRGKGTRGGVSLLRDSRDVDVVSVEHLGAVFFGDGYVIADRLHQAGCGASGC